MRSEGLLKLWAKPSLRSNVNGEDCPPFLLLSISYAAGNLVNCMVECEVGGGPVILGSSLLSKTV